MDQPTIYSETVRETVRGRSAFGVWRLAFGVRRSAFGVRRSAFGVWRSAFGDTACGRNGSKPARQICRKNNTVGAPSFSPYRFITHLTCSRC
jgi:hypothetical protein